MESPPHQTRKPTLRLSPSLHPPLLPYGHGSIMQWDVKRGNGLNVPPGNVPDRCREPHTGATVYAALPQCSLWRPRLPLGTFTEEAD
ncbi:hypothetical protein E2C01_050239 [Portunus trituberculatus]|uniref:Uncharacterized protein n=1 Tax=Portunus trituberculatus TaxID=210409 RepID=A0A5B7GFC7_PORTR|nr:hypothetical protein [Portunus trituberculatus]